METQEMLVDKLAFALAKAQGEIKAPIKNRIVDFIDKNGRKVHYTYADLADVIDCIRVPLTKNELSLFHQLEYSELGFGMRTTLLHSSGQKLTTWYPLPAPGTMRPQEFGSFLTYGRRYSVSLLIGIASEEDDDGQTANASNEKPKGKEIGLGEVKEVKPVPVKQAPPVVLAKHISKDEGPSVTLQVSDPNLKQGTVKQIGNDAAQNVHKHNWLKSTFKPGKEYCSGCKLERAVQ